MEHRAPSDYLVPELRELLRINDLSISGPKAELIARLESYNANIWEELDNERRRRIEAEQQAAADDAAGNGLQINASANGNEARLQNSPRRQQEHQGRYTFPADVRNEPSGDDMLRRELELVRRERDLARA